MTSQSSRYAGITPGAVTTLGASGNDEAAIAIHQWRAEFALRASGRVYPQHERQK